MTVRSHLRIGTLFLVAGAIGAQGISTQLAWADDVASPLQSDNGGPPNTPPDGPHHQPPPEAFEACRGHATGDACTVTFDSHQIQGTCNAGPDNALFCRPACDGHHHGPPPEAFEACNGHAAGDACSVSFHGGENVAGTCTAGPDNRLACRPEHMPPHP